MNKVKSTISIGPTELTGDSKLRKNKSKLLHQDETLKSLKLKTKKTKRSPSKTSVTVKTLKKDPPTP